MIDEREREELEQARLSAELERRNRVLAGAKQILGAALSSVSEEDLGRTCLSVAEEVTGSQFGFIGETDADGLCGIAISDPGWDACTMADSSGHMSSAAEFKLHGLYGEVITSGESLLANAPSEHPASIGVPPEHPALSAFLGVPLQTGDRTSGILAVSKREGGYRDADRRSLEDLAPTVVEAFARRRAEAALRERERRLRRFYEAGLVGVIYWNTDGEIVDANDRFLEMTGYTREELEGGEIDWLQMTPPEFAYLDERSLMELQADGVNSAPFEKEYLRKDGTRVPIILAGAMLDDERHDGVAFVLDISERKRLEQDLHDAEARAKELIRYAPTGIYEIDFRGPKFRSVNDAMCALTGYEREELLAMSPLELLDAESQSVFQERIAKGFAGEPIPDYVEYRTRTKDGRLREVVLNVSFTYADATIDGALVVGWDVTERKQVAAALTESEERFRSLFESMTEGVALHELICEDGRAVDYRVLQVNPAFARETGIEAELARDRLASDLYGTGEAPYLREYARVAEGGEPYSFETYFAPLGRHFRITAVSSEPGRFATVFENITERKRAEAETQDQLATTRALLEAATATATLDLDTVLRRLVDIMAEQLGRSRVVIHLFEGEREVRTLAATDLRVLRRGQMQPFDDYSVELQSAATARKPTIVDYTQDGVSDMAARERERLQVEIVLYVPLIVQERLIGVATIDEPLTYLPFSDRDVDLASGLAAQAATAIENARLFEAEQAAQRRAEAELARTRLLQQVAVAATTSVSLQEVTDRVLQAIFEGMDLKVGAVYSYARDDQQLKLLAWHGIDEASYKFQSLAVTDDSPALVVRAVLTKSVVMTSDVPLGEDQREVLEAAGVNRSQAVALPIEYGGAVVGSCSFVFERDRAFDTDELELFRSLALILGQAIENARLFEAERRARERAARDLEVTQLLLRAARSLNSWTNLDALLDGLANVVLQATRHTRAYVALLAEDRTHATFVTTVGKVPLPPRTVLTWEQLSPVLQDALTDGCARVVDFGELPPEQHGIADSLDSRLALHVPIVFAGRVLGHIAIDDPGEHREFTEHEIALVEGIASQAAAAIENARLHEAETAAQSEQAAQEERSRLARDLHDSVTQALFAATLKAEALTEADESLSNGAAQVAEEVRRMNRGALAQMRALLLELRGDPLEDVPITQLLRQLVEAAEGRSRIKLQLTVRGDAQLPLALHAPIYRITQEALNNVTRHAGASRAWVELDVEPDAVRLVVGDDGRGFEPGASDPSHMGLRSMRERAQDAGAQFDIITELGGGTVIAVDWKQA